MLSWAQLSTSATIQEMWSQELAVDERIEALESAVTSLKAEVENLRARVCGLEGSPQEAAPVSPAPLSATADLGTSIPFDRGSLLSVPALAGRSLIVLAGAFLLRALTESGGLPLAVGVGVGLAYACVWMIASGLAARASRRASAAFHSVCAAAVFFPLVWEATVRLQVFGPPLGSLATAAVAGCGLLLAARARLPVAAWVFGLGGMFTEVALLPVESPGFFATVAAIGMAGGTALVADDNRWSPLEWLLALAADLMVLRIVALAGAAGDPGRHVAPVDPTASLALALALPAVFLAAVLWRSDEGRHAIRVFDLLQSGIAVVLGFLGAIEIATSSGHSTRWLGIIALASGALALGASFSSIKRRPGQGRRFVLLSSLGVACILIGVPTLLGRPGAAVVWAVLAAAAAALGGRFDRISLRVHAVLYGLGAAGASGALQRAVRVLVPGAASPLVTPSVTPRLLVELVLVATVILIAVDPGRMGRTPRSRLPFTLLVALTALVLAGGSVAWFASLLAGAGAPAGASLASARTVALAALAIVLAVLGRRGLVLEASWLVYPVLALALLELIVGDLTQGSARTLFLSFLACGVALVVCPWLLRGRHTDEPDAGDAERPGL